MIVMKNPLDDLELIEAANFTHTVKFTACTVAESLRYLKKLSRQLGIPIGDLQASHVIEDLKYLDQKQRAHTVSAAIALNFKK